MGTAFRYDSSVAQFQENPFTRDWPEPASIDALFRYCVERFFAVCKSDPRSWLTEGDLQTLLGQLLREELPRHGLPACAVHVGFSLPTPVKQEQSGKHPRSAPAFDLVLVIPQTIHWVNDSRWEVELALIASVKRTYIHALENSEELVRMAGLREKNPGLLRYLVVMGYHDDVSLIEAVERAALAKDITYLGDNYTGLVTPVRQEKLL
jgi:hypothetical protein